MACERIKPVKIAAEHVPIPRTADRCELYLNRLALVVERAGKNASAFVPIARRLERELAEARAEAEVLTRLRQRQRHPRPSHPTSTAAKGHCDD